jgi:protein-L-isoaspartate(D-aspartate) O-methyltransferase
MAKILRDELNLSPEVFEAIKKVPRHEFVPYEHIGDAYSDIPLPIGEAQTISAPHMVAIMCELLNLGKGMKVLEVGGGSGYHAAVVSEIIGDEGLIIAVERREELAKRADEILKRLGYRNIRIVIGDGSKGFPLEAPYDRIYVTASAPDIPKPLLIQLKNGGKMIIPVGEYSQYLYIVEKDEYGRIKKTNWGGVRFVQLIGEYGFK